MSPGQLNIREILNVFYTYVKIKKNICKLQNVVCEQLCKCMTL